MRKTFFERGRCTSHRLLPHYGGERQGTNTSSRNGPEGASQGNQEHRKKPVSASLTTCGKETWPPTENKSPYS